VPAALDSIHEYSLSSDLAVRLSARRIALPGHILEHRGSGANSSCVSVG